MSNAMLTLVFGRVKQARAGLRLLKVLAGTTHPMIWSTNKVISHFFLYIPPFPVHADEDDRVGRVWGKGGEKLLKKRCPENCSTWTEKRIEDGDR